MSIRRSSGFTLTSTSSASGSTATVAVEVWMRPLASVTGTRWTRGTPLSYLRRGEGPGRGSPEAPRVAEYRDDVLQRGVLAGERLQPLVVAGQFGAGHLAAQFFVSRLNGGQFVQHLGSHDLGVAAGPFDRLR